MKQTEIAASAFAPFPAAELARASIRFVVSVGALIGISLLLASL
jgi:hypothetical protein